MNFKKIDAAMTAADVKEVAMAAQSAAPGGAPVSSSAANLAKLAQLWVGVKPFLMAVAPLFPGKWGGVIKRFVALLDLVLAAGE